MRSFDLSYGPVREAGAIQKVQLAKSQKRSMTAAEKILWSRLRSDRLNGHHFRRQCVIRGFIADFYCHELRLVVEVDGTVHDTQEAYDAQRDEILKSLGLRIIRFSNDAVVNHLDAVAEAILQLAPLQAKPRL